MTALAVLFGLAYFHLLGLAIVLCIGAFLIWIVFALVCAILAIPAAILKWLESKVNDPSNPEWKRKVDNGIAIGLFIVIPVLLGGVYIASLLEH